MMQMYAIVRLPRMTNFTMLEDFANTDQLTTAMWMETFASTMEDASIQSLKSGVIAPNPFMVKPANSREILQQCQL